LFGRKKEKRSRWVTGEAFCIAFAVAPDVIGNLPVFWEYVFVFQMLKNSIEILKMVKFD
jgi:hypothetical protein